jgi:putative hydrolase of the HAD superfamily
MKIVCFDVGGVLVRISQSWQEAVDRAQVSWNRSESEPILLPTLEAMNEYQAGRLGYTEYLNALADFLAVTPAAAETVHHSILQEEYPGIPELVADLRAQDCLTAVLSNTNQPHWDDLLNPAKFPSVASVDAPHASHLIGHGKPEPTIYAEFNRLTDSSPGDVIFFDDNQANVDAANAFGWRAYRVDPWGDPADQMRSYLVQEQLI